MSERGRLSGPGSLGGNGLSGDGLSAIGLGGDAAGTGAHDGPGEDTARRGSLSGPGSLAVSTAAPVAAGAGLPDMPLAEFAARYGLKPSAERPPVLDYIRQLWQRRHFIVGFATARNVAMYTEARLGQVWQVLTPLLNAAVYYLIFGLLLNTSRGLEQNTFIEFLVTGIFVFNFTQRSVIIASRVMHDSLPLIRALHFPRACLPLGYVIIELQQLLLSFSVLIVIVLATGEPITWYWLLAIPALLLQTVFNVGVGLLLARWGAGLDDVSQLLPFIVRTWLYASGVIFSIQAMALSATGPLKSHPSLAYLMEINPAAVFISLVRNALLASQRLSWAGSKPYNGHLCALYRFEGSSTKYAMNSAYCHAIVPSGDLWLWGAGWALAALVVGFFFFWRAESEYGRG